MDFQITEDQMVNAIMKKQVPLCVKHGVIAVYEGTRRVTKKVKDGRIYRYTQRINIPKKVVAKTRDGFVEAFNLVVGSWADYGYTKFSEKQGVILTARGMNLNKVHAREVDASIRMRMFHFAFEQLFRKEIKEYNENSMNKQLNGLAKIG